MEINIMDMFQPWKSHVMINMPWAFPLFLVVAGTILSIFSWIRGYRITKKNSPSRNRKKPVGNSNG